MNIGNTILFLLFVQSISLDFVMAAMSAKKKLVDDLVTQKALGQLPCLGPKEEQLFNVSYEVQAGYLTPEEMTYGPRLPIYSKMRKKIKIVPKEEPHPYKRPFYLAYDIEVAPPGSLFRFMRRIVEIEIGEELIKTVEPYCELIAQELAYVPGFPAASRKVTLPNVRFNLDRAQCPDKDEYSHWSCQTFEHIGGKEPDFYYRGTQDGSMEFIFKGVVIPRYDHDQQYFVACTYRLGNDNRTQDSGICILQPDCGCCTSPDVIQYLKYLAEVVSNQQNCEGQCGACIRCNPNLALPYEEQVRRLTDVERWRAGPKKTIVSKVVTKRLPFLYYGDREHATPMYQFMELPHDVLARTVSRPVHGKTGDALVMFGDRPHLFGDEPYTDLIPASYVHRLDDLPAPPVRIVQVNNEIDSSWYKVWIKGRDAWMVSPASGEKDILRIRMPIYWKAYEKGFLPDIHESEEGGAAAHPEVQSYSCETMPTKSINLAKLAATMSMAKDAGGAGPADVKPQEQQALDAKPDKRCGTCVGCKPELLNETYEQQAKSLTAEEKLMGPEVPLYSLWRRKVDANRKTGAFNHTKVKVPEGHLFRFIRREVRIYLGDIHIRTITEPYCELIPKEQFTELITTPPVRYVVLENNELNERIINLSQNKKRPFTKTDSDAIKYRSTPDRTLEFIYGGVVLPRYDHDQQYLVHSDDASDFKVDIIQPLCGCCK